ncbi:efflux transporter, hydrophobe/amphiphile efflux-3 (HAE3) family [Methanohalophilus mahii DSM 5219]|uniref:Efflux transporter, hydrophobe/amphiphile efflux-3 (HAE3) family n=2 Tax=Methanohalophilus mahii TaxID=2176 RepID=D5E935_METMS|nr:efflux transporter, hydrophobe/amphiphile efflux-3 (HAE3) family [Methanohalophilus mahii DSM 5219]
MSTGTETYVDKDTKVYQDYENIYLRYLGAHSIVIMISDEDIKSPEVLKAIDRLDQQVSDIPGVVETLHIADAVKTANYMQTGKMQVPENRNDIVVPENGETDLLLPDNTHTLFLIQTSGNTPDVRLEKILGETEKSVLYADFPPATSVVVTGEEAFSIEMQNAIRQAMPPLIGASALLIIIALYLTFRGVRWRVLPIFIVGIGIIYTFGAMGYIGIPMTMVSMAAFPILIGLGIDYMIQFHNRLEEEFSSQDSEKAAVVETVKHTAPAILTAYSISALGFVSLLTSSVPMIRDFGKMLFIGTFLCYIAAQFIGVPAIYLLARKHKKRLSGASEGNDTNSNSGKPTVIERLLDKTTVFTVNHPVPILIIAGMLCIFGLYADQSVPVQTDEKEFVPQDMDALIHIDNFYKITERGESVYLVIQTGDNTDPGLIRWMDSFSEYIVDSHSNVYGSTSIVSAVKSLNSGSIPDTNSEIAKIYDTIPQNQKASYLHGNNLLMMELSVNNDLDGEGLGNLIDYIQEDIAWYQSPPDTEITITGSNVVFTAIIGALTTGRLLMTLLGVIMIFIGLLFVYRDWLKALVPVVTMFMVIGWAGGVMYYSGLSYSPMTATLGAMILGIGTEYAIHIMERYYEEKEKGATSIEAMRQASTKIGSAIVTSGLTTIFGFSALIVSPFLINQNFGLITVMIVFLALISSFFVFPATLILLEKIRDRRKGSHDI